MKMTTCKFVLAILVVYLVFWRVLYCLALMSRLIVNITEYFLFPSPEALGIVPGAIFLICLMFCLVGFATNHPRKVRRTSF
jgi:hypothetical protein